MTCILIVMQILCKQKQYNIYVIIISPKTLTSCSSDDDLESLLRFLDIFRESCCNNPEF